jgi:hypothetical protein
MNKNSNTGKLNEKAMNDPYYSSDMLLMKMFNHKGPYIYTIIM